MCSLETWGCGGDPWQGETEKKVLGKNREEGPTRNLSDLGEECVGRTEMRMSSSSGDSQSNILSSSVDPVLHWIFLAVALIKGLFCDRNYTK